MELDPDLIAAAKQWMQMYDPTEDEKRQLKREKALIFGLGLLGTQKGRELEGIGKGGLLAVQYGRAAEQDMRRDRLASFEGMKMLPMLQGLQDDTQARKILSGMRATPSAAGPSGAQSGGDPYDEYMQRAAYLDANNPTGNKKIAEMADAYREKALKFRDENQGFETVMKDGKPTIVQRKKFGAPQEMAGMEPKPDFKQFNTGKTSGFVDPLTGRQGPSFQMETTPGEDQSRNTSLTTASMADRRAREANQISMGNKQIDQVHMIRKELNALPDVSNYRAALPMLKSAQGAPDTRAGDLDLTYAVGKILDPGSVVREGEMILVGKSANLPQQVLGALSLLGAENGRLTPQLRRELGAMLHGRVSQLKDAHDAAVVPYMKQAQAAGLPADQIFIESVPVTAPNKPLVKNATAVAKAQEAIRKGAPAAEVRQRLIEQGFDPGPL